MNDILLFILSIIGLFALYWVLFGQTKYNKKLGLGSHSLTADQLKVIEENSKPDKTKK
jgi:hypothetical protein